MARTKKEATKTKALTKSLKKKTIIEKSNCFHIYGIFLNDKCIYIGSTGRADVDERWKEHRTDLMYGRHSNRSLQKKYGEDKAFEFRLLSTIPMDSNLLQFFMEFLYNSLLTPTTNKCILQQGRKYVSLSRIKDKEFVKYLIKCIEDYFDI